MTDKVMNDNSNGLSRRKFLKGGAILSAAVGLTSLTGGKTTKEVVQAIGKKELDSFPYEIAPDYKRYSLYDTEFSRVMLQEPTFMALIDGLPGWRNVIDNSRPGFTALDMAFNLAAGSVEETFAPAAGSGRPNTPMYTWELPTAETQYEFGSKEDATKAIKKAARTFGADLVGITHYDEKWVYDPMFRITDDFTGMEELSDKDFPFKPKSVIVMVFEMDYAGIATSPSTLSEGVAMLGYSRMAETSFKLSKFINHLGYKAFGSGNDTAISVPYAIAAGLGEQGRQGLLITYEYGPRVRIAKVFTEMDLVYDKPIEFGANKFCQVCKKCADACPSQSIGHDDEMGWEGSGYKTVSNQKGVKKYYVNVDTCYQYWYSSGNGCGVCIAACPYNKPDFWHHKLTTSLTSTPLKPFLNEMDDFFGYGDVFNEESSREFWDFESYAK